MVVVMVILMVTVIVMVPTDGMMVLHFDMMI